MSLQHKENKWFPKDGFEVEKQNILQEANSIVRGDRQADYGDTVANFKHIANIASAIRKKEFTAEDCCVVLIAVKLAREQFKHKRDNLVDLAGYTEILNQIKEAELIAEFTDPEEFKQFFKMFQK